MKKTLLLLMLLLTVISLKAQQSVLIKKQYKPEKKYITTNKSKTIVNMDLKGDSTIMAKIEESGKKFPMVVETVVDMEMLMETDKAINNNSSFILTYNKFNNSSILNGETLPMAENPLKGVKIYGKIEGGSQMKVDSIAGHDIEKEIKDVITNMVSQLTQSFKFPDKPVKIGESFMQEMPLNIPIAGNNMQMVIKSTYKLLSINNNLALFDIVQDATADFNMAQGTMKMNGKGTGKMDYSITDNLIKSSSSDFTYTYTMDMGTMKMIGTSQSITNYNIAVSDK